MCELLGISSSRPARWDDALTLFRKRGGDTADNPDGWGLAYRDDDAWQLYKAAEPASRSEQLARLSQTVVTKQLIAHVRKANPPSDCTLVNTHPFVRECCGRSWVFAHNGRVPEVTQPQGCCYPHSSRPQGQTDSEHAFYFLLDEIAGVFGRATDREPAEWFGRLAALSADIAAYGQFNFLMSDGEHLIAYGHDRLHHLQRGGHGLRAMLIASEPLTGDEPWEAFRPGELQVFRNGERIAGLQTKPVRRADEARG